VFGASVLLAERGKPETENGIRTRGSQGPDDSQGHVIHMADLRGAFKANSAHIARAVKELLSRTTAQPPASNPNDQNSCKKFSQITANAQNLDSLPPKHTFRRSKN
jgi:hypothetical protein